MPIAEQITSYTSWVAQTSYLDYTRVITLRLESGTTVYLGSPQTAPLTGCNSRPAEHGPSTAPANLAAPITVSATGSSTVSVLLAWPEQTLRSDYECRTSSEETNQRGPRANSLIYL
jgi:hypothetical protein